MNKYKYQNPALIRKSHHLKLKDVAFILGMKSSNLSSFEAGKSSSPKAFLGYHTLFNFSIQTGIKQVMKEGFSGLLDRALTLAGDLEYEPDTNKNRLRKQGISELITHLMKLGNADE